MISAIVCSALFATAHALPAKGKIVIETVVYKDGSTELEGFLAYDSSLVGMKSPGIVVIHQWAGLSDHEKERSIRLAELGYVAFAVDIYGKGIRPSDMGERGKQAGKYKGNRALFRERLLAGYKKLQSYKFVNRNKMGAIGFCFGGTGVLELARTGVSMKGGVSFHGGLDNPKPGDSAAIRCPILVCTGADDPSVPPSQVSAFENEMTKNKVNFEVISYPGAVHAFTQKAAGNDISKGAAYNQEADEKSWVSMKQFFVKAFK